MINDPHRGSKNSCGFDSSALRRLGSMIVALFVILSFTVSCSNDKSIFPAVPDISDSDGAETQASSTIPSTDIGTPDLIRIAAPLSQETILYLSQLYTAKKQDLLGVGVTGQTVSLDFLETVQTDFSVELLTTSETGANMSSYLTWSTSGTIPDIIMTDSMSELIKMGALLPLDDLLAGNPLLSPASVYSDMVSRCSVSDTQYGVPYAASISVIFVNHEVLDSAGVTLSYEADLSAIFEASEAILSLNDPDDDTSSYVVPLLSGSALIPYLPASFDPAVGFLAERDGEIDWSSEGFRETVLYIRKYDPAYFAESMSDEDRISFFGTLDPILSKRVGMWVGRSDEVSRWSNYMPYTLGMIQIPSEKPGLLSPPALTVFPLCISSRSEHPAEAIDFAVFIALDPDAILLRRRLENHEGFIPVVKSPEVWDRTFSDSVYSGSLYKIKDVMSSAYFTPFGTDSDYNERTHSFLNRYASELMDPETDPDVLIESIGEDDF
jgi:ABC-type glycerol-3-phosphate transport system substrate-binding protein